MKRSNLFKKAAWALLMLAGLFTFASCSSDEEEDYKGGDSTVVNNKESILKLHGTWQSSENGSYVVLRNPKTGKETIVQYRRLDDKLIPYLNGKIADLDTLAGLSREDLGDKYLRIQFQPEGKLQSFEQKENGSWEKDDDGNYGFNDDGFYMKIGGTNYTKVRITKLTLTELELTETTFDDHDLNEVVVKKVIQFVRA